MIYALFMNRRHKQHTHARAHAHTHKRVYLNMGPLWIYMYYMTRVSLGPMFVDGIWPTTRPPTCYEWIMLVEIVWQKSGLPPL